MNHKNENHILFHIQKLFPRQKVPDTIEVFLIQRIKIHADNESGRWIELGSKVTAREIIIQPNGDTKEYTGKEICEIIIQYLNNEYWLVVLWNLLYEDSKNSVISREIVRAFIKHCVSTIAQNLIEFGPEVITCADINDECLPHKIKFYQTIFSYNAIMKEMRSRIKKRMKNYSMGNARIENNINIDTEKLIDLFDNATQGKYSDLIRAIQNEKNPDDKRYIISFLPVIYNFTNRFSPFKSKIIKEIRKLSAGL